MIKIFIVIFLCISSTLLNTGCEISQGEQISEGVYAIHDAAHAGRFDQVQIYSDQLVKTVPPPQHRIPIQTLNVPTAP